MPKQYPSRFNESPTQIEGVLAPMWRERGIQRLLPQLPYDVSIYFIDGKRIDDVSSNRRNSIFGN